MRSWSQLACASFVAICALAVCAVTVSADQQGGPVDKAAVTGALSDKGLTAAAARTDDRLALYGLAWLAEEPARGTILDKLVKISPADAPAAAALRCRGSSAPGEGIQFDVKAADAWLEVDPDNGAAHCFKAYFLDSTGAIEEVTTGLARKRFETYDTPEYRQGIPKALDVLRLEGQARLCALERAIDLRVNYREWGLFGAYEQMAWRIRTAAKTMTSKDQAEVASLLIKLGGKLATVGGAQIEGAYSSYAAVGLGFAVMRDAAADPDMKKAYDMAVSMSNHTSWSEDTVGRDFPQALRLAAGALCGDTHTSYPPGILPADKPLFDATVARNDAAIRDLIAAMPANPDDLAGVAVVQDVRTADALMSRDYPKAAEAAKAALDTREEIHTVTMQVSAPERSKYNIKDVGLAIGIYENDHKEVNPPDLKTLVTEGYLGKGATIESPITGRPYVFLWPNVACPASNPGKIVLAYDDAKLTSPNGDWYVALFFDLHVGGISADKLEEQLKNPPK